MAKSQGWKRPEDAECLKVPFTGKLDGFGKMTLIVSNKVYFLGKSIFLPLGKKIVAVKPRWIIKFSFAPRPLKVRFMATKLTINIAHLFPKYGIPQHTRQFYEAALSGSDLHPLEKVHISKFYAGHPLIRIDTIYFFKLIIIPIFNFT